MNELERTIEWHDGTVLMIDQRVLPLHYEIKSYTTYQGVAEAIHTMVIRGAPAIGAAAGFGMALAGLQSAAKTRLDLLRDLEVAAEVLRKSRPTAVNLFWAIDRVLRTATDESLDSADDVRQALVREAQKIADEDVEINKRMAEHGAALVKDGDTILTHCNTGALAVVDYGTALGVIRRAHEQGKRIKVFADETPPALFPVQAGREYGPHRHGRAAQIVQPNFFLTVGGLQVFEALLEFPDFRQTCTQACCGPHDARFSPGDGL